MRIRVNRTLGRSFAAAVGVATVALLLGGPAWAEYKGERPLPKGIFDKDYNGIFIVDGEFVHNVGELQLNITNWGLIGSWPSTNARWADAPSAMWPAGSGVDYLWAGGIWIGAVRNGIPLVSTGQFEWEFLPNPDDPLSTIWDTAQGATGGARYPDPSFDDDSDGQTNEDPLNGVDDDGDGDEDEDFAAIGNQHFRCEMTDNTPLSLEFWPDHEPLDIAVVQESFAWENESVDDFIGFQFTMTNVGVSPLSDVFLGWFADSDVGPRGGSAIAEDDLPWFFDGAVQAADGSLVPVSVACMYDADGDGGQATGFFGIMFLGHPTDPAGISAPDAVRIRSFQAFSGNQPFDRGGNPTNDAERYDLLSRSEIDNVPPLFEEGKANDFRIMLANGPFSDLAPGESLTFQACMVVGDRDQGVISNATEAALTFYGAYFDRDSDPSTGIQGRETKVCLSDFEDQGPTSPLFDLFQDCADSTELLGENPPSPIGENDLDAQGCAWINADCPFEEARGKKDICEQDGGAIDPAILQGCTGVQGKEFNVPWLVGLAPDPPGMRIWETDGRVQIFWNSISQLIPDVRLQKVDFESYRIWRADGWDRPFGSSIENGPESRLWRLIAEFDVVDFFELRRDLPGGGGTVVQEVPLGANTGLDVIKYTPAMFRDGTPEQIEFQPLRDLVHRIVEENPSLGPAIDPAVVMRYFDSQGTVTPIGLQYPELQDWVCCTAETDSAYFEAVGVEFYTYEDREVHNGIYYFYSVTATDFNADPSGDELTPIGPGIVGDPQSNFQFAVPRSTSQSAEDRGQFGHNIYVVPNPATRESLSEFSQLNPNSDDPTGIRIMFANLPQSRNTIQIFTLSGDLVETIPHDGTGGNGAAFWNLISRNGQEVVSGIYLYSVESDDSSFDRVVGRFVIIR